MLELLPRVNQKCVHGTSQKPASLNVSSQEVLASHEQLGSLTMFAIMCPVSSVLC